MRRGPRFYLGLTRRAFRDLSKGWLFRLAKDKAQGGAWKTLAWHSTRVRQRPELGPANLARLANIRMACQRLDGLVLQPGSVFSMEALIGDPRPSQGWQIGPVLLRGQLEQESGGGLCQVCTTLFHAGLLGGLRVLERHGHSVDYWGAQRLAPLGLDAAYAWGLKDLKLENPFACPVRVGLSLRSRPLRLHCQLETPLPGLAIPKQRIRTLARPMTGDGIMNVMTVRQHRAGRQWIENWRALTPYRPNPKLRDAL
jgi:hypothetical protein